MAKPRKLGSGVTYTTPAQKRVGTDKIVKVRIAAMAPSLPKKPERNIRKGK